MNRKLAPGMRSGADAPWVMRGLYAITDGRTGGPTDLVARVGDAIRGGARLVQYRDKSGDLERRLLEGSALQRLCLAQNVPLIVNDDPLLAARIGAAGVHLGREDADVGDVRRQLGPRALIGVSCYDSLQLAVAAEKAGASYVAFGSFFQSLTKPYAVSADIGLLARAKRALTLPVVAIGGITPQNGRALLGAGADMLAVINAVFDRPDVYRASREFAKLFSD
jgi:thiamine-phosphate pyrophosphorylase